jgi:uncharacterized glyoxalase superfamily protein PhnB
VAHPALAAESLSPGITATDLQRSLRFYTEGLGFEITDRHEVDGVLRFASLKAGNANLGIGQDDFAKGRDRVKGVGLRLWISTNQDIAALAARAKAAGLMLDNEPAALPWGPMAFAVTDPDGFKITVANDK